MFKNIQNKKGFTLVELAIVLVVIGLLMGMAFKGKSLVDAARIKADVNRINKVATAVNVYNSKYDALPGMRAVAGSAIKTIAPADFYDDLIKEGLLQEGDLKIALVGGILGISGCRDAVEATGSVWEVVTASEQHNLCLSIIGGLPFTVNSLRAYTADTYATNVRNNYMKTPAICQMEGLLDDKNLFAGDGRLAAAPRRDMNNSIKRLTDDNFDCSKYQLGSTTVEDGATYLIRIF